MNVRVSDEYRVLEFEGATQFAGSIVGEILYARLFCGLRFFDKNHKLTREFPPCAVKQVCSIISTAKSQGRTTEEVLPEEIKLAANGLEKLLNSSPHKLCFSCTNRFCPIKKKIAQSGGSSFRKTQETETVGDSVYQYAPKSEERAAA